MSLPTFVSDIPVLHEVTEDATHFFSLDSVEAFVRDIRILQSDPILRYKHYAISSKIAAKNASAGAYLEKIKTIYKELGGHSHLFN
jgi:hypothetical protein